MSLLLPKLITSSLSYYNFNVSLRTTTPVASIVRSYYRYRDPITGISDFKGAPKQTSMKRPEFRKHRAAKVLKIDLPDYHKKEDENELTPDAIRQQMKKYGIQPPRAWMDRPTFIASTNEVVKKYVPPEGDGKLSLTTKEGLKQNPNKLAQKYKTRRNLKKILEFDIDFTVEDFLDEAEKIYIDSHKFLADFDEDRLHDLVTEHAYPKMTQLLESKQIRWSFLKTIEAPRVVNAAMTSAITDENKFGQLTVRFFTRQLLAVYDRFGRLMHGSEVVARDVLEYVVFEKHLANTYGRWRVHDKIIPDWAPPPRPSFRTYKVHKPPIQNVETKDEGDKTEDTALKA